MQSKGGSNLDMTQKSIRKVLLAVPPTGRYIREDRCQTPIEHMKTVALRPPIDLMYAGASFQQGGAECRLADFPAEERGEEDFKQTVRDYRPDLVLFSITTPGLDEDMRIAAVTKEVLPGVVTAAKGAHFNVLDRDALERYPGLDMAFRGEYEPACRSLAEGRPWSGIPGITYRDADGAIVRTENAPFIQDLDSIPFPDRSLARNELYLRPDTGEMQTTIVTNRGCPFNCIYCLANQVGGRHNRMRSVASIMAEIRECVDRYGIRSFLFRSDLFTANRQWVIDLCQEIQRQKLNISWACNSRVDTLDPGLLAEMKKAHCWMIAFGTESGSQEMLDRIGKRTDLESARKALKMTRQSGILSSIYFLIGLPWETHETLKSNERFAREIDPDFLEVFYIYPFPGTALHAEAVRLGLLKDGEIPRRAYDYPAIPVPNLPWEELVEARNHALRSFYLRPRVILRTLRRAKSWAELANYVRYGWSQLKDFF